MNEPTFVIGMEILDNMPHDRLYADESGKFQTQAVVEMTEKHGEEILSEFKLPVNQIKDPYTLEFIKHYES